MSQTVRDLAEIHTGVGTPPDTEKVNAIWAAANEDLDQTVVELADSFGQYVSESYIRRVLREMSPGAFGL